ncbi:MAG TPA: restriction endonuclease [Trebonia sp.]|nr:restriction endonuclease [Trebonia sp.]
MEAAEAMTGHQFEFYDAQLLESLGWTRIRVTGDKPGGDGGADILATDPRNRDFAIQCKRYAPAKAVTPPAEQLAARTGIQLVARPAREY